MSGDNESLDSPWRGGIHGSAMHPPYESDEYDVSGQGGPAGGGSPVTEYGSWRAVEVQARQQKRESGVSFSGPPQAWANTHCGAPNSGGLLCLFEPHEGNEHSWSAQEQPAPKHNDGPSMHDLVVKDLLSREPQWDLSVGSGRHIRDQVADDLLARKEFGLSKYGTHLQTGNGRSFLLDLYQEQQDAVCYARGRLLEVPEDGLEWLILFEIYDDLVGHLVKLRRLLNAAEASTESLSVRSASSTGGERLPW